MNVNGVTSAATAYTQSSAKAVKKSDTEIAGTTNQAVSGEETGVIYEPSSSQETVTSAKKYKPNAELAGKLKADAEARTSQLQSLVQKLMAGQGNAIGTANDMWSFLRTGNFTVDAATKAQAQADIAEDGYWGVTQTSDRILDFAKAISGGDPDKLEEMRAAFEKGFKKAEKTWGGKLPEISQKTYTAVMEKFDAWKSESSTKTEA